MPEKQSDRRVEKAPATVRFFAFQKFSTGIFPEISRKTAISMEVINILHRVLHRQAQKSAKMNRVISC